MYMEVTLIMRVQKSLCLCFTPVLVDIRSISTTVMIGHFYRHGSGISQGNLNLTLTQDSPSARYYINIWEMNLPPSKER